MVTPRHHHTKHNNKHGGLRGILCFIAVCIVLAITAQVNVRLGADDSPVRPVIPDADRYQTGRLFLERADRLLKTGADVDYQVLTGDVRFRRGDMYMYCDSAHFYDQQGSLRAYGNVRMEQGDTLFVYADELEYIDSTEIATLYADPGKKVRLINRDVELRTDIFNYDMAIELGYYEVGGELIDKANRLTSVYGEYAPNTKDAIFKSDVHLNSLSRNDTLDIYTYYLHYNTDTHIADLSQESTIISKDGTIYTDSGEYNTESTVALLYRRSTAVTKTGKTITGDTLFYDNKLGYGEAWGNMVLNDTVNKSKLLGDYGFYNELTDSAFVTGHALAVDYSSADSLSLHGDTIQAYRVITITHVPIEQPVALPDSATIALSDSVAVEEVYPDTLTMLDAFPVDTIAVADTIVVVEPIAVDTVVAELEIPAVEVPTIAIADTTHHIVAYPNVRFFRNDLQGVCDSMIFIQKDSMLYMHRDPLVWSDNRQISGLIIAVHMNDSTADRVEIPSQAFMAEEIEPGYYNQMSGRELKAYLADRTLRHLDVSGNVMMIFYPMEDDSTYNKVASAESSYLAADFDKGQIEKLKMWPQSTEVITPLYLAKRSILFLRDFRWDAERRPSGHDDLFPPAKSDDDDEAQPEGDDESTEPEGEPGPEPHVTPDTEE